MPRRAEDADDADRRGRAGRTGRARARRRASRRLVLRADEDVDPTGPRDAADELAEVGPVLERREDLAELVALGELRGLHHVEQPVAEDLLDRGRVVVAQDPDDPLADPGATRCIGSALRSGGRGRPSARLAVRS